MQSLGTIGTYRIYSSQKVRPMPIKFEIYVGSFQDMKFGYDCAAYTFIAFRWSREDRRIQTTVQLSDIVISDVLWRNIRDNII